MNITVRLFGRYTDLAGQERITFHLQEGGTVEDLLDAFVGRYHTIQKDKPRIMVSINKVLVSHDTVISESDDIAFTPPVVSGG